MRDTGDKLLPLTLTTGVFWKVFAGDDGKGTRVSIAQVVIQPTSDNVNFDVVIKKSTVSQSEELNLRAQLPVAENVSIVEAFQQAKSAQLAMQIDGWIEGPQKARGTPNSPNNRPEPAI